IPRLKSVVDGTDTSGITAATRWQGGGGFRLYPNLTVKKIPQAVLTRCEWGRDDYSLKVDSLPPAQAVEEPRKQYQRSSQYADTATGVVRDPSSCHGDRPARP